VVERLALLGEPTVGAPPEPPGLAASLNLDPLPRRMGVEVLAQLTGSHWGGSNCREGSPGGGK
jgi:hypothetical protein